MDERLIIVERLAAEAGEGESARRPSSPGTSCTTSCAKRPGGFVIPRFARPGRCWVGRSIGDGRRGRRRRCPTSPARSTRRMDAQPHRGRLLASVLRTTSIRRVLRPLAGVTSVRPEAPDHPTPRLQPNRGHEVHLHHPPGRPSRMMAPILSASVFARTSPRGVDRWPSDCLGTAAYSPIDSRRGECKRLSYPTAVIFDSIRSRRASSSAIACRVSTSAARIVSALRSSCPC